MELDFSKLEGLSYRGIDGDKARAEKDKLIERGFTLVEGEKTPFDVPPAKAGNNTAPTQQGRLNRKFTGIDGSRNYRAMYRAACDFHEQHNPPTESPEYWERTAIEIAEVSRSFNNDPFIKGLLCAIYEELGREYKLIAKA